MDKIKVAIRLRPFNKREIELGALNAVTINDNQVILNSLNGKDSNKNAAKSFTFDMCFDSSRSDKPNYATQQNVYEGLGLDILESSMAGYNACIFAYGQTGSGKSFTMMGSDDNKGLIPRLCESIFDRINSNKNTNLSFKVEVSFIEIYNEKVRDLLDPSGSKLNLKVREHQLLGPYVDGLTQLAVSSYKDIETILNEGNKSRTVAATNMNAESSRSHAVFCVKVSQTIADEQNGISGEKISRISLVDLAGSEKVSKTGVEGERLKEGCNINRSLHTLGQVISTLADNSSSKSKPKHIPYRDSVLTWLLKDSIGGNSKTVMVSTISPSYDNYEETLSTLRYADRAKRIVNNAVINEDPNAKIIRNLREELEMLKKELEKAKEQISADALNDRLQESEKLYKEFSKPWDEKLAETEKIQKKWNDTLQSMGISVQSSGIKVEKDKYYLVNLNADPSLNELLVYYLKDLTLVGRPDAKNKQDIQLLGPGISNEHCAFYMKNNHICIAPIKEANTWVNGKLIRGETVLHNGDRIVLGTNHFFRINCPADIESNNNNLNTNNNMMQSKSYIDFNKAQEEVLLQKSPTTTSMENSIINQDDENNSTSSLFSDSNNTDEIELDIIKKYEQEYSGYITKKNLKSSSGNRISSSSSTSSINKSVSRTEIIDSNFRKGLQKLKDKLLRANSLCREANSLCKEMNKLIRFSVTLQIPAYNLTPNREKDTLLSEPAIVVKSKYNLNKEDFDLEENKQNQTNKIVVDMERFESYIYQLREVYAERLRNNLPIKDNDEYVRLPDILTGSLSYYYNLIGVANLFLDVLYNDVLIPFEYDIPIISQQGEIAGRLKVRLQRLNQEKFSNITEIENNELNSTHEDADSIKSDSNESNEQNNKKNSIRCKLNIIKAYDLPINLNNLVFCQYQFWSQAEPVIVKSVETNSTTESNVSSSTIIQFDYETEFSIDVNEDFLEYCSDGALSIEVLCHRCNMNQSTKQNSIINKSLKSNQIELNQIAKYQSLIDAWSEVSKSYELSLKILELNGEGKWRPVELKHNDKVNSGGIYQLKQGQSRQISVFLNQTRPNSTMFYNGLLFNLEPHKIDKISIGSLKVVDANLNSLDSYQDVDLNKLKQNCNKILENRRLYLCSQLEQMPETDRNEEEKERYELLHKQLIDLGHEQIAINAPSDNSHLPGSTIEWSPPKFMEQYIPIIFLDLNDEYLINENSSDSDYSDNEDMIENRSKKSLKTCGQDCHLLHEQAESSFRNLKIISWNDSSLVEMIDSEEVRQDFIENELNNSLIDSDTKQSGLTSLRAVARWDSSEHNSIYLDKETPIDKHVYLILKINIKMKLISQNTKFLHKSSQQFIDLVLRKRICVNVYSSNTISTNRLLGSALKSLLGSTNTLNKFNRVSINKNTNKNSNVNESSSVTYRIISNIPKLLTEIENRESLAIKAATSITQELIKTEENQSKLSLDNSLTHFEQYAKTIEAVDSILKRDRIQQQLALKKTINIYNKNGLSGLESDDQSISNQNQGMKKTFSVPNLIKNSFGSIKNLSIYSPKQPVSETKPSKITESAHKPIIHDHFKTGLNYMTKSLLNSISPIKPNLNQAKKESNFIILEHKPEEDLVQNNAQVITSNTTNAKARTNDTSFLNDLLKKEDENEKSESNKIDEALENQISDILFKDLNDTSSKSNDLIETSQKETSNEESSVSPSTNQICESSDLNRALSDQSIASTITNTSLTTSVNSISKKDLPIKEDQPLPEWIKENAHVIVSTNSVMNRRGYIRYIGPTKFQSGTWIGVELEQPDGKNDGSVKGIRYFTCGENRGVFVRADKLTLVVNRFN